MHEKIPLNVLALVLQIFCVHQCKILWQVTLFIFSVNVLLTLIPHKTFICKDFSCLSLVQTPELPLCIGMLEIKKYGEVSVQSFLGWMLKQMQMLTLSPLPPKVERTKFVQLQKLQYYHIGLISFSLKGLIFKHFTLTW